MRWLVIFVLLMTSWSATDVSIGPPLTCNTASTPASGGAQQATFRARTDLVAVDVLVTAAGQVVTDLSAAEFQVTDRGMRQAIDSLSIEKVPLDVVLVFDTSQSMANARLRELLDAARGVLARLREGDRAALLTFSERVVLHAQLTSDKKAVQRALDGLQAVGRTSLFDALYAGLTLRYTTTTRSMVLLLTDGRDTASWTGIETVMRVARESDVVVYGVGLDPSVRDQLKDLAEETGGELLFASSERQLTSLFVGILGEMRARYVLTYYPRDVDRAGWHPIEVLVSRPGCVVKARRGYLVSER